MDGVGRADTPDGSGSSGFAGNAFDVPGFLPSGVCEMANHWEVLTDASPSGKPIGRWICIAKKKTRTAAEDFVRGLVLCGRKASAMSIRRTNAAAVDWIPAAEIPGTSGPTLSAPGLFWWKEWTTGSDDFDGRAMDATESIPNAFAMSWAAPNVRAFQVTDHTGRVVAYFDRRNWEGGDDVEA